MFPVFQSKTNNFQTSIKSIDVTLTGINISDQSGPGNNGI